MIDIKRDKFYETLQNFDSIDIDENITKDPPMNAIRPGPSANSSKPISAKPRTKNK